MATHGVTVTPSAGRAGDIVRKGEEVPNSVSPFASPWSVSRPSMPRYAPPWFIRIGARIGSRWQRNIPGSPFSPVFPPLSIVPSGERRLPTRCSRKLFFQHRRRERRDIAVAVFLWKRKKKKQKTKNKKEFYETTREGKITERAFRKLFCQWDTGYQRVILYVIEMAAGAVKCRGKKGGWGRNS